MGKKCLCSLLDACQNCGVVFLPSLVKMYHSYGRMCFLCPACEQEIELPKKEKNNG